MTPPPEFAHLPWHWIDRGHGYVEPARWVSSHWMTIGSVAALSRFQAHRHRWRYIAPAEPPNAVLGASEAEETP